MTLPDERYRAIHMAEQLLKDMLMPGNRVPKLYKDRARAALRHYPSTWDLARLAAAAPDVIVEKMEPLHRMVLVHEQKKPLV